VTSLGKNSWGDLKSAAPLAEKPLIDMAPPRRERRVVLEEVDEPHHELSGAEPPSAELDHSVRRNVPLPGAGALEAALVVAKVRKAKGVAAEPKTGGGGFVETTFFLERSVVDRFRVAARERGSLMNVLLIDLVQIHGPEIEQAAKQAGRTPRRRAAGAVDPIRKSMSFAVEELKRLDALAERCNWPRSRVVSALMKLV
jgi:hypothetical protein